MSAVFGIQISKPPSCLVMDKSFLDGVSSAQLQFYTRNGWTFAIPEVLMYEHFRKRDGWRIAKTVSRMCGWRKVCSLLTTRSFVQVSLSLLKTPKALKSLEFWDSPP
jgi:hypothetical protein